jgi:hypothetical protein
MFAAVAGFIYRGARDRSVGRVERRRGRHSVGARGHRKPQHQSGSTRAQTPEFLARFLPAEIEKWAVPIRASGLSMD